MSQSSSGIPRSSPTVSGPARPLGSYGIDAPWVPWLWTGIGVVFLVIGVLDVLGSAPSPSWYINLVLAFGGAVIWFAGSAIYFHASLRGKFVVWAELLDGLALQGTENVLDLGCGHGAVTILAAQRVPHGTVAGIDLWRSIDQSGNSAEATAANLELNGVADRVHLDTGDMTALPYPDESFDLVTASVAIHNIPSKEGRAKAVTEAVRVLRPGGRVLIADIRRVPDYAATLRSLGAAVEQQRSAGWRIWWTGPWMATTILQATK
ncbi:SAM-dependent methyltransferase [Arthrobacter livingstonensis]|uniref:SAM-dependent methyltransferase n=1 Tax=Arthrobacter livingstonensis TaxID=670078 RepID=A0A2V5L7R7_9MICC|nr:class I SAM-dependent methyltransferase [Arthrobacter livingstonensis]PYI66752.1 SAM-dependent methyltransferase [Arthrobacter livingstonensis]